MCGCLTRIGIDKCLGDLAGIEDSGEIINLSFFSNMFGCFVLGKFYELYNIMYV